MQPTSALGYLLGGYRINIGIGEPFLHRISQFSNVERTNLEHENVASNSLHLDEIRVQLRPKCGVLRGNFGEESQ